jgi:hypothetical protein
MSEFFTNTSTAIFHNPGFNAYYAFNILAMIGLFVVSAFIWIWFDQKHLSKGLKNISPIENNLSGKTVANILNIVGGYFVITLYAFIIMLLILKPLMMEFSFSSHSPDIIEAVLLIFLLSSGIIVRYTYLLISTTYGNVLWDFFAIPAIFIILGMAVSNLFTTGGQPLGGFPLPEIILFALIGSLVGMCGEIALCVYREQTHHIIKHHHIHETLGMVPMSSQVITGRDEMYKNLARMLRQGASERKEPKYAVGTSIFFESDNDGEFLKALEDFIGPGDSPNCVRYLGPKHRISAIESEIQFNERMDNLKKRENIGVTIKHFPIKEDSFRFLVVNQKYASIEFPTQIPLKSGKHSRSMIAVTFENGVIASMLNTIFENMWDKAIELEKMSATPHAQTQAPSQPVPSILPTQQVPPQINGISRWTCFSLGYDYGTNSIDDSMNS